MVANTAVIRRARARAHRPRRGRVKPRVLFISRRIQTPLPEGERRRWNAVRELMDFRVIASGSDADHEFRLAREPALLAGPAYYAMLPVRIARDVRRFPPTAVVAQ